MIAAPRPSVLRVDSPFSMTALQWEALRVLGKASDTASAQACDVWQFAVEIEQLYAAGLDNTGLRQLLCQGYLEHAQERTNGRSEQRIFLPLGTLVLPKRTCFVLTARGREAISGLNAENGMTVVAPAEKQSGTHCSLKKVPHWDSESRQLWWQACLTKEFRRLAVNQETTLAGMEEEGWPRQIDDPLPQTPGIDSKARLHDTIKSLNRHHLHSIICFRGDGNGTGVGLDDGRGGITNCSPDLPQNAP